MMQRHFKLSPSQYLAALLIAAHSLVVTTLFPLSLPLWAKVALATLVFLNLGYLLRNVAWLSAPSSCIALQLQGKQLLLSTHSGEQLPAEILRDSLVTPYLSVINVLPQGARYTRSIVILPDSMDAESFRQLRVWLKWNS